MKRIALAEDDDRLRELWSDALTGEGFKVTTLEDGYELLDYLERWACDLVLADVGMPGLTGVEAIAKARAKGLQCPVIILTTAADEAAQARAAGLTNTKVIAKPSEVSALVGEVRAMIVRGAQ